MAQRRDSAPKDKSPNTTLTPLADILLRKASHCLETTGSVTRCAQSLSSRCVSKDLGADGGKSMSQQARDGVKGGSRLKGIGSETVARHDAPAPASVTIAAPVTLSAQTQAHGRYGAGSAFGTSFTKAQTLYDPSSVL